MKSDTHITYYIIPIHVVVLVTHMYCIVFMLRCEFFVHPLYVCIKGETRCQANQSNVKSMISILRFFKGLVIIESSQRCSLNTR